MKKKVNQKVNLRRRPTATRPDIPILKDGFFKNLSNDNNPAIIMWQADNSVKNWQNFPTSNPKPDLNNINTKFDENGLIFTQVIAQKQKYGHVAGRWLSKTDKICPLTTQTTYPW